jgi:predicted helicase
MAASGQIPMAANIVIDAPHSVEENPRYIVDLIKWVTTVSVETVKIVEGLPQLGL